MKLEANMGMIQRLFTFSGCLILLLGACAPRVTSPSPDGTSPPEAPVQSDDFAPKGEAQQPQWLPKMGDELLSKDTVYLDEVSLLVMESFPPQYSLFLKGSLPTPCHKLRVHVTEPDEEGRVQVEVYALTRPDAICIQVLEPFEVTVPLPEPSSTALKVWVNGEYIGEILP